MADDDLCRALYYTDSDFLNKPMDDDKKAELIGRNVFPYRYIDDTATEKRSYITMKFSYVRSKENNLIKVNRLRIWCYCTISPDVVIINNDLRYDYIKRKVCDILEDRMDKSWLGKLELVSAEEVFIDAAGKHFGVVLDFEVESLK